MIPDAIVAPNTALRLGGPAQYLFECGTVTDVVEALQFARDRGLPWNVLGSGTNVVVSDDGIPGVVIRVLRAGIHIARHSSRHALLRVHGGERLDGLIDWTVRRGLMGIERLSGIPGTVGAAPVQNVGAYGQEIGQVIDWVGVIRPPQMQYVRIDAHACDFAPRSSVFKSDAPRERVVIWDVGIRLARGYRAAISDAQVRAAVIRRGRERYTYGTASARLIEIRNAVLAVRRVKGMLAGQHRSVGSFFLNPRLTPAAFEHVTAIAARNGAGVPSHRCEPDGTILVHAAWLIEASGFRRGQRLGGDVELAPEHALNLIVHSGATSQSYVDAGRRVARHVSSIFGITLVPEPVFMGDLPW